jgi:hypothetical protein
MSAMLQSDKWKSAAEYAADLAQQLEKCPPPSDVEWSPEATSDHLPVYVKVEGESLRLLSWNMLNPARMHHQINEGNEGQHLNNHPMVNRTGDNPENRLVNQSRFLEYQINSQRNFCLIIFLQEVCPLMSYFLEKVFDKTHYVLPHATVKGNNFNVTMLPRDHVTFNYQHETGCSELFQAFATKKTAFLSEIQLKETNENILIVNAHLGFGTKKKFAEALLEESSCQNKRILVVGDFNASLRTPVAGECDNVTTIYSDKRFSFFSDQPSYNHLNLFMNTIDKNVPGLENGSISRMYDRFDHFMLVKPAIEDLTGN